MPLPSLATFPPKPSAIALLHLAAHPSLHPEKSDVETEARLDRPGLFLIRNPAPFAVSLSSHRFASLDELIGHAIKVGFAYRGELLRMDRCLQREYGDREMPLGHWEHARLEPRACKKRFSDDSRLACSLFAPSGKISRILSNEELEALVKMNTGDSSGSCWFTPRRDFSCSSNPTTRHTLMPARRGRGTKSLIKKATDEDSTSDKETKPKKGTKRSKSTKKKEASKEARGGSVEPPKKGSGSGEGKKGSKVEALPPYMDLDYWHGNLPNEDSANLLKEEGQYLLRKDLQEGSTAAPADAILLSVRSGQQVINALIREVPRGFRICDREFDNINGLGEYYQIRKIPIKITEEIEVTLGNPVRRKAWELRHKMITVQKELGSGSYGVVYLALLTYPRQKPITVAAKMLSDMDNDSSLALWKEARVMQEYDHPNIVKFYGVCNDSVDFVKDKYLQPYYLVMEFINGGSVDNYLKANPKMNIYKRTKIAIEAVAGLDYLHSRLCINRDIAARNLLIDKVAKVADFGLTRKTRNYKIDPDKSMNLRWIAPDVFESSCVNKATDVYAFGITLYEIFVVPYDIPYSQWEADEVYEKVVEKGFRLSPPREMPKEISGLMKVASEASDPTAANYSIGEYQKDNFYVKIESS